MPFPVKVLIAIAVAYVLLRVGFALLRGLSQPLPPPPPPGEMRKVDLRYRCTICGAEVRMTRATDQEPDPPRHCQEDMELVAPIE